LSEGEKREKQNTIDRQEKVRRESEAQQERDRKNRENIDRTKGGANFLPNSVIKMIMDGNLRGVLEYMSDVRLGATASPAKHVMKMVAGALSDLNLNTKIEIVESSKIGGDLAQYDPVKDVIYVSVEGLTATLSCTRLSTLARSRSSTSICMATKAHCLNCSLTVFVSLSAS